MYKALSPCHRVPVHQQADASYVCPTCGATIQSSELVWIKTEDKKKDNNNATSNNP